MKMGTDRGAAVVIVHWGNIQDTEECLGKVLELKGRPETVIVIDNGGLVDAKIKLRDRTRGIEWFDTESNLGFGAGANVGYRIAQARALTKIWFLNNDAIPLPGAYAALKQAFESNTKIGAVSSFIFTTDDEVWYSGGDYLCGVVRHNITSLETMVRRTQFITGCSFIMPVWKDFVPFVESLFMYGEDALLSVRLSEMGHTLLVARDSKIRHKVSAGLSRSDAYYYYMVRNGTLVARKICRWGWPIGMVILIRRHFCANSTMTIRGLIHGLRGSIDHA